MAKGIGKLLSNFSLVGGAVGVIKCDSDSDSWYCSLSKVFSSVIMVITLLVIIAIIIFFIRHFYNLYVDGKRNSNTKIRRSRRN